MNLDKKRAITLAYLPALILILSINCLAQTTSNDGFNPPQVTQACNPLDPNQYYGVVSVINPASDSPTVSEAPLCNYVNTIEVDRGNGCQRTLTGNLPLDGYYITHIPACTGSVDMMVNAGKDFLGNMIASKEPLGAGSECPGTITSYDTQIDLLTQNINVTVTIQDTGMDENKDCTYQICVYGLENPERESSSQAWKQMACSETISLKSGETETKIISSEKDWLGGLIGALTGTNWNANSLNGRIKIELNSTTNGQITVDEIENAVCQDNIQVLCESTAKDYLFFGEEKPVYGVVYQDSYLVLGKQTVDENKDKFWLLNERDNTLMDVQDCALEDPDTSEITETKYYTLANNDKYQNLVETTYGQEPFYQKYKDMYGADVADGLYCYKTDLRSTSKCKELNIFWYAFPDNTNGDMRSFMTQERIDQLLAELAK